MKTTSLITGLLFVFGLQMATAQETTMRYSIPAAGTAVPAAGNSNQLRGNVEYDDTTMVVESFSFDVPLFTFMSEFGSYNYIAAVGAASTFPYMSFKSTNIDQSGEDLLIKGSLYLRGQYQPLTITAKQVEDKKIFYLDGNFTVHIRDYFMFSGGRSIPPYMNIDFRMVFDKEVKKEG